MKEIFEELNIGNFIVIVFFICREDLLEWSSRRLSLLLLFLGGRIYFLRRIFIVNGIYILFDIQEIYREQDVVFQEYMVEFQFYDFYQYIYNFDKGYLFFNSVGYDFEDWEGIEERFKKLRLDFYDILRSGWKNSVKGKYSFYIKYYSDFDLSFQFLNFLGDDYIYVNVLLSYFSEQ